MNGRRGSGPAPARRRGRRRRDSDSVTGVVGGRRLVAVVRVLSPPRRRRQGSQRKRHSQAQEASSSASLIYDCSKYLSGSKQPINKAFRRGSSVQLFIPLSPLSSSNDWSVRHGMSTRDKVKLEPSSQSANQSVNS